MAQRTYTVKPGDTKSALKKRFGLGLDFAGYRSSNPNSLFSGEVLEFDDASYNIDPVKAAAPIALPTDVNPSAGLVSQDPSKVGVNPNPGTSLAPVEQVSRVPASTPSEPVVTRRTNPLEGAETPNTAVTQLSAEQTRLESEISDITNRIANLPQSVIDAKDKLGINEDQKQLAALRGNLSNVKQELLVAQDRGTELLEEGKQFISDNAGTSGDLGQLTNADLRKNELSKLALSRTYSRLGDAVGNFQASINDSIAIINENAEAERAKLEFDIQQRNTALDRVIKVQGDLLSNAQTAKLEELKFQNQDYLKKNFSFYPV